MYLYYPLSSKKFTFENVFSSESISPPSFYEKRGFGIGYFNVLPEINHNDAIILYSKPPKYELESGVKFVLEIDTNLVDIDSLIFLSEGVFAYQKTIYLNAFNFRILFFSEKDMKVTLLKAETSLPTKKLGKYFENFKLISENECFQFREIGDPKIVLSEKAMKYLIAQDKKYNHFKGFIYGLVCGLFNIRPQEEVLFNRLLREIVNSFAEFKSRIYDVRQYPKYSNSSAGTGKDFYLNRLLNSLEIAEQAYFDFFSDNTFSDEDLYEMLLEDISRFNSIDEVKQYINICYLDDELLGTNKIEKIKDRYLQNIISKNGNIYLKKLKSQIKTFAEEASANKTKINLNELNSEIKVTLIELENSFNLKSQNLNSIELISLNGVDFNLEKNEITINNKFQNLHNDEVRDIILIVNILFRFSQNIQDIEQKKMSIMNIVRDVGEIFNKSGKETLLYQYLNNETDTYSFEKISSSVLKNFVAFIFNIESLERLEKFIDSKNIEKPWLAYAFWGAFNGFANLSGNFTRFVFDNKARKMQSYLDEYLMKFVAILKVLHLDENLILESYGVEPSPMEVFYENYIAGKYNLSIEELAKLIEIKNKTDFHKTLKVKFKISKKDSDNLFELIKRDLNSPLLFN